MLGMTAIDALATDELPKGPTEKVLKREIKVPDEVLAAA